MIKLDNHNYRKHGKRNKKVISDSLSELGAGRSILIDNDDVVIAGNGVFEQASLQNIPIKVIESDGSELIAVKRTDLSTNDVRRKRLAAIDNSASDLSEWDISALSEDLTPDDFDIMGIDVSFKIIEDDEEEKYYGRERQRTDDSYNLSLFDKEFSVGKYDIPFIECEKIIPEKIIGFNYARSVEEKDVSIHFFIDDYQFERVWNRPTENSELLSKFKCVFTPDFSLYSDMPLSMMIWNVYRSRLIGQYMQRQGIHVIPTVSWYDERTFDFCYDGIAKGSVVAVSTVGVGHNDDIFIKGFEEMVKRISPETVLIYGNEKYNEFVKECADSAYCFFNIKFIMGKNTGCFAFSDVRVGDDSTLSYPFAIVCLCSICLYI